MPFEMWCIFICVGLLLGMIVYMIIYFAKNKDKMRQEVYEMEEEKLNDEGEVLTVRAKVVDLDCGVNMVGHRTPKTLKHFVVTFECDGGEIMRVSVPEVFYNGFEVGLVGILTLIDGQLTSFEPEEEEI